MAIFQINPKSLFLSLAICTSLTSCSFLQSDADSTRSPDSGSSDKDATGLVGLEHTDVSGDEVSAFINGGEATIARNLNFFSTDKSTVAASLANSASKLSRDVNVSADFVKCVNTKIGLVGLQKTVDTVSFAMDFDFIKECDRDEKPDDLVGEIKNTFKANVTFGCASGQIAKLSAEFLKDLPSDIFNYCKSEDVLSRKFGWDMTVDARKTFKVKNGTEYEVNQVVSILSNVSLTAKNGSPCNIVRTNSTTEQMDSCRMVSQSKTFTGKPVDESNSPNDKVKNHPRVLKKVVTVGGAILNEGSNYYSSANTTFLFNGWEGKLTYKNGFVAPTWEANLGSAKRGGTLGQIAGTNNSNSTSGNQPADGSN
ncbi:MAG: hypothetical protein NT027_10005, partial [Proteobacteria bacterium]|nr:hypothetical protein [Pseudomonadota bacterium]